MPLILSRIDPMVDSFFFAEFSFRIQQERGKTAVRRVAWPRPHRSCFDFTDHEFRKAVGAQ